MAIRFPLTRYAFARTLLLLSWAVCPDEFDGPDAQYSGLNAKLKQISASLRRSLK